MAKNPVYFSRVPIEMHFSRSELLSERVPKGKIDTFEHYTAVCYTPSWEPGTIYLQRLIAVPFSADIYFYNALTGLFV